MLHSKIKLSETQTGENLEYTNNAAAQLDKIINSLPSITNLKSGKINIQPREADLRGVDLIELVKQKI